jgi:hypothetical protein
MGGSQGLMRTRPRRKVVLDPADEISGLDVPGGHPARKHFTAASTTTALTQYFAIRRCPVDYMLIYEFNDYPDMGGGTQVDEFETVESMHDKANELLLRNKDGEEYYTSVRGIRIESRFKYEPIQVATKYKAVED